MSIHNLKNSPIKPSIGAKSMLRTTINSTNSMSFWQITTLKTTTILSDSTIRENFWDGPFHHPDTNPNGLLVSETKRKNLSPQSQVSPSWHVSKTIKLKWPKSTICAFTKVTERKTLPQSWSHKLPEESTLETSGKPSILLAVIYQLPSAEQHITTDPSIRRNLLKSSSQDSAPTKPWPW